MSRSLGFTPFLLSALCALGGFAGTASAASTTAESPGVTFFATWEPFVDQFGNDTFTSINTAMGSSARFGPPHRTVRLGVIGVTTLKGAHLGTTKPEGRTRFVVTPFPQPGDS